MNHDKCSNPIHARNAKADAACELAAEFGVDFAMASWALAGGRVDARPALVAAAVARPEYTGKGKTVWS